MPDVAQTSQSYDADMLADVRAAFEEVEKEPATDPVAATEKSEPEAAAVETQPELRADHPTDPKRYADGTFKATTEKPEPEKVEAKPTEAAKPAPAAEQQAAPVVQQQQPPTAGNPPPGWSVKSKAEWDKLPETIRADIVKREQEVNAGFAELRGMSELRPYVEMARANGQTLKQALDLYTGIENHLRQKPLEAILHIAGNAGYSPQRLAMELVPHLGQSNGQGAGAYPGHQQPTQDSGYQQPMFDPSLMQQWISPLAQEINQMKALFQQQQDAERSRQMSAINSALERFTANPAHRYYANVEPAMVKLIESGVVQRTGDYAKDLKAVYHMACRMDPEINDLLINERIAKSDEAKRQREKEAAEKAKLASRSITGSPSAGAVRDDGNDQDDSIEADVRRAFRAHAA